MMQTQQDSATVGRFELRLVLVTNAFVAGLAVAQLLSWIRPLVSAELTLAMVVLFAGLLFYPAWRLWSAASGHPWPFLPWFARALVGAAAAFVVSRLMRPLL